MPMTDEQYRRVVEELKASKAHRMDSLDALEETAAKMRVTMTCMFISDLMYAAKDKAASADTVRRAAALEARASVLTPRQTDIDALVRLRDVCKAAKAATAADLDRLIARASMEIAAMEGRAA
jgi:hypothetical protein